MNSNSICRAAAIALGALIAMAVPARADWAVLRNGRILHVTGYERRDSNFVLRIAGGEIQVPASAVLRFEPEDVFPAPVKQPRRVSGPYGSLVAKAARQNEVSPRLLSSVIQAESNFRPRAVSSKGALGLMQLMPSTARSLAVRDPMDPAQNVQAGARYLKQLLAKFGNLNLALAAYNAGPGTVRLYRGVPPFPETRAYIERVRDDMKRKVPPDPQTETVKLTCAPLQARCRELALPDTAPPGAATR